jgi:serine/threonine protein kinase
MEESAAVGQQQQQQEQQQHEQLSDDEDTIEFEIEVVTSSASSPVGSRPSTPIQIEAATTDEHSLAAGTNAAAKEVDDDDDSRERTEDERRHETTTQTIPTAQHQQSSGDSETTTLTEVAAIKDPPADEAADKQEPCRIVVPQDGGAALLAGEGPLQPNNDSGGEAGVSNAPANQQAPVEPISGSSSERSATKACQAPSSCSWSEESTQQEESVVGDNRMGCADFASLHGPGGGLKPAPPSVSGEPANEHPFPKGHSLQCSGRECVAAGRQSNSKSTHRESDVKQEGAPELCVDSNRWKRADCENDLNETAARQVLLEGSRESGATVAAAGIHQGESMVDDTRRSTGDSVDDRQQRPEAAATGNVAGGDGVVATNDSGDGCEWRLVDECLYCPAGWSLVDEACKLRGQFSAEQVHLESASEVEQSAPLLTSGLQRRRESQPLMDGEGDEQSATDLPTATTTDDNYSKIPADEPSTRSESIKETQQQQQVECGDGIPAADQKPQGQEPQHGDKRFGEILVHLEEAPMLAESANIALKGSSVELLVVTAAATTTTSPPPTETADTTTCVDDNEPAAGVGGPAACASPTEQHFDQLSVDCLGSSSSLYLLSSADGALDDEDLEREFDEEPEFQRRDVQVKRNKNPRDEYELGDELGRGKFGTVYRCVEMSSGLKLAAKFIHMRRSEDREDVEREVAIMSVLQHKRLLQLYDAFDDGLHEMCLITELVEGGELFERIVDNDFDLTEKKAAIFMRQICEGVEYMHGEHIVHLDMKPENILCLSRTGNRIKLIDFGLARRLDPNKPIRVLFGTPDFAAPEVLAYETVTPAADMWSVGVICYVLLSGLSPFMGDTDLETMANVMRATFDFNDQAFEAISDLAKDFISKLLVREPAARLKPAECLKHPWLQRGGGPLEAHIRERRKSSFGGLMLATSGSHHRLALEQAAMLTSLATAATAAAAAAAAAAGSSSCEPTPPTPPSAQIGMPNLLAHMRPRASFGADSNTSASHLSLDKRRLKKYVVRRKWHKTVHAIMALGRMGANLKLA